MLRGIRFEDAIKSLLGLAIFIAAMITFGPGLLERSGINITLEAASAADNSFAHQVALRIENELPKVDVLDIKILNDRVVMTVVDLGKGEWQEDELTKLIEVTFFLVDVARDGELPILTEVWQEAQAITIESETVHVYLHKESLACPWVVLEQYDGTNAASLVGYCALLPGTYLEIDPKAISWAGRGE
jgi:hypothetical protein